MQCIHTKQSWIEIQDSVQTLCKTLWFRGLPRLTLCTSCKSPNSPRHPHHLQPEKLCFNLVMCSVYVKMISWIWKCLFGIPWATPTPYFRRKTKTKNWGTERLNEMSSESEWLNQDENLRIWQWEAEYSDSWVIHYPFGKQLLSTIKFKAFCLIR